MKCPWCREELSALAALRSRADACPHCGKQLTDPSGETVRDVDLLPPGAEGEADAAAKRAAARGALVAAVLGLLTLVPLLSPFAYVAAVVAMFVTGRFFVCRPFARHFSPLRKLVTRWNARLATWLVVLPLYALPVPIPGAAAVAWPLVLWGWAHVLRAYFRFHFRRERAREGILGIEKVLLLVLALLVLCASCAVGVMIWLGAELLTWFGV